MATLNVGAGQTYATVSAAVNAARSGDVIAVQAGTYTNDFATITKDITITGVGGMANFVATVAPPNGKGIFVTNGNVTLEHLSFSGAAVADGNGAGVRYEGGNLVVIDSYFHNNQDGLLANAVPNGTIRIVDSEFGFNGIGDGYTHNLYVNNIASLVIDNSYFHDANLGHEIKSRAQSTTITNSRIYDGTSTASYSIDLPNGGVGVIRGNVIQQGANSDNPAIIHYGGESAAYAGSSLLITNNIVVNDMSGRSSAALLSNATTIAGTLSGNSVYGLTANQITNGQDTVSGTTYLSAHPTLDTSSPWLGTGGGGGGGGDDGGSPDPSPILGTAGPDKLVGTAGADTLTGFGGDDVYTVNNPGDVVVEANGQGTDTVLASVSYTLPNYVENLTLTGTGNINGTGNALANVLTGNSGNNVLDGAAGADHMAGGAGNDTYHVDNAGDVVIEAAGQGTDTVLSTVSHTLANNVENLTLTGSGNINGTGNTLANVLTGNAGNNVLDGGAGADHMAGGAGNDTYHVNNAGDVVVEAAGQGTDTVLSTASYTLTNNVENLTLIGTGNISGTGNALANVLTGNAGNNVLDGGAGADHMAGGAGNDTYRVDNAGDVVVEAAGQGTDTVLSTMSYTLTNNVENLTLGSSANVNGTGNALANVIIGNSGNNMLNGGAGSDTLTGNGGADTFVFRDALGPSNIDTITDFNVAADTIRLDHTIFGGIVGTGTLTAAQFTANASGMATDSSDHIIYETDTGKLFYDSNGSAAGGATQFALLSPGLELTNKDFFIV